MNKHTIYTITGLLCLFVLSPASGLIPEATDKAGSGTVASQHAGLWLFDVDLSPYYPDPPPTQGNAARYYTQAFAIWNSETRELSSADRNRPYTLEQSTIINKAIDLIEKGATFRDCDFYDYYEYSPSAYYQERPNTVGIKMLVKLIMRRTERDLAAGRLSEAERRAKCCIIFSAHLYQTAETHTQATMSMEVLSASFGWLNRIWDTANNTAAQKAAFELQKKFHGLLVQHVNLGPSLRSGLPNDLDSILRALTNPLAPVRCEGLRTLGNIMDPRVEPDYLADPNYVIARERAERLRTDLIQIVGDMAQKDPDPRVARLAGHLYDVMTGRIELKNEEVDFSTRLTSATNMLEIEQLLNEIAP